MELNEQSKAIEESILGFLYPAFFNREMKIGLLEFRDSSGISEQEFDKIVDALANKELIRAFAAGYSYDITPAGILLAEEKNLVPYETIKENRNARTNILDELAKVYENEGKLGSIHFQTIADNTNINSTLIVYNIIL